MDGVWNNGRGCSALCGNDWLSSKSLDGKIERDRADLYKTY